MAFVDNHDLFKEMYYKELSHRNTINSRISIPLGLLPLLIGGGLYVYNNREFVQLGEWL